MKNRRMTAVALSPSGSRYSTGPAELKDFNNKLCDACPYCRDTCDNAKSCHSCQKKQQSTSIHNFNSNWLTGAFTSICSGEPPEKKNATYTMCQLKRHNHADSSWILVGDTIYDATPYIRSHPGGTETILRKSGGSADCTEDLRFHSSRAQREWRRFKVGTLVPCPRKSS